METQYEEVTIERFDEDGRLWERQIIKRPILQPVITTPTDVYNPILPPFTVTCTTSLDNSILADQLREFYKRGCYSL